MKKLLTAGLALTSLLFAPAISEANCGDCCCETTEGFYLGAYGGVTWWHDAFITTSATAGAVAQVEFDVGYNVGGFLGFRCCNGLRIEGEIGYRNSDLDTATVFHSAGSGVTAESVSSAEIQVINYMANFIYECAFQVCDCCLRPYFGVGFGGANVSLDVNQTIDGVALVFDDDETVFAYQLIMGLAYPINECMDLAIEYRFMDIAEAQLEGGGERFETREYVSNHNILVSLKYVFGGLW